MRHIFIPMFAEKFRALGEAALQAGNCEGTSRKHHFDLETIEEAGQFFGVLPRPPNSLPRESLQFDVPKVTSVSVKRVA